MNKEHIRPGLWLTEGSCWDILADTPDEAFGVSITDPPYGERTHAGARTTRPRVAGAGFTTAALVDFASIDVPAFLRLCRELVRVTRRWVLLTCDWRHAAAAEEALPDDFIRCGVWVKLDSAPQYTGDRPGTGWEAVLMLHRAGKKRWNGGGHHAVWEANCERGLHPTQKPLGLVRKWVRQFSEPGELIFDPFAGSGTTGLAAKLEGRDAYLVELDPEHSATIRKRLDRPYEDNGPRDRKTGDSVLMEMPLSVVKYNRWRKP